ncbi:ModD protein [Phaeovulum vinaykumarii]|uniref:Putative pyrophosphorylase ModD n=1 Tax=Phaeovulum vinaykumarii TaxID=407234 RepID=A0A1N7MKJ3_9RHOB|nr:ModD protein [Phaeovulum vinaykumarii]SIS86617.1 molybdenum transport protein [Phaeovulum vinaykumarii]SOC13487.1 molybdenum transport protein [Phaeovulum vinaykumarii]
MLTLDDATLRDLLDEDVPYGDLTTRALAFGQARGRMVFAARGPMVVAGSEEATRMLELLGCAVDLAAPSGSRVEAGGLILGASGSAEALLAGWKVSQTLVEWASGLATRAAAIVAAAQGAAPEVRVACTRKAVPGTRALSFKAVVAGGAGIHRAGLSDTVLLFPEHRVFDAAACLKRKIGRLRAACPERKIVVEVTTRDEALSAAEWGADVVQLEKFAPEAVAEVARALGDSAVCLAAAGGVNAQNAGDYAAAGAQVLVTSAPYYAPPADVKVTINPA